MNLKALSAICVKGVLSGALALALALPASAQDLFDDIYYNPDKKTSTSAVVAPVQQYEVESVPEIDVDAYNRRGFFFVPDSAGYTLQPVDSVGADFANTRQIERFYNPDLLVGSADSLAVAQAYAAAPSGAYGYTQAQPEVNIYVANIDPYLYYGPGYGYPYYYSPYWGNPYWGNPYWGGAYWGPGWSWSWGWNPGWGPGWDWGWGPGAVGPPPAPGRPYNPRHPGAMASNRPNYGGGSIGNNPPSSGQRPGVASRHPGSSQAGVTSGSAARPGTSRPAYRYTGNFKPAQNNGTLTTTSRPSITMQPSVTTNGRRPGVQHNNTVNNNINRQPTTNTTNRHNYNNNSGSRPGNNSGWGTSTGRGGSGSFGGGNRGGGHGGTRGGRH